MTYDMWHIICNIRYVTYHLCVYLCCSDDPFRSLHIKKCPEKRHWQEHYNQWVNIFCILSSNEYFPVAINKIAINCISTFTLNKSKMKSKKHQWFSFNPELYFHHNFWHNPGNGLSFRWKIFFLLYH